jgi:preprotein translocase subunit SecG
MEPVVYGLLLTLLLLVGIFMSVVILLQAGKGGGLAAMGGATSNTDSLIGGRQAATLLTKATWISGALFLTLALALSVVSSRRTQPESILRGQFQAPATQTAPPPLPGLTPEQTPATTPATTPTPEGGAPPQP